MSVIKLQDVAEYAKVSLSTASLILNGKGKFTDEVRSRVISAAEALGYQKNVFASAVASSKVSHVGILVHEDYEKAFEWHFIRQIIINIESVVTEAGYFPILIPVSMQQDINEVFQKIVSSGAGGVFSIHYAKRELFRMLEDRGIPVVVVNNGAYQNEFSSVCIDDFSGAYMGTSYLIQLGHTRIDFVDYERPDQPVVVADRYIGYRKALEEAGIDIAKRNRITVFLDDVDGIVESMKDLFVRDPPTALFVHDDFLAAVLIVALSRLKLAVPGDVSVIAPGDTLDYNQPFIPKITTVSIDTCNLGHVAGEMMVGRLADQHGGISALKISEKLIERGSCALVKTAHR